MNKVDEKVYVSVKTGDPSAIGLFGLAMVTLVASSQKLEITHGLSYVLPWAIFLGAFAQLYASILDFKKENAFGGTAFGGYGFFWLGVAVSWMMKLGMFGAEVANNIDPKQLGIAFAGYLVFSIFMTLGATVTNKILFFIFVMIDFLFVGLTFSTLGILEGPMHQLAAYSELTIAVLSFYLSAANILNQQFGHNFLWIGKPISYFKKKK
ncbi:MAG: acetate uptake transporter [Intestinibacillus sp.]